MTSLLYKYIDLHFKVIKKADNSRYANGNDIRLVSLGTIVLIKTYKLMTSSGKHFEVDSHAHTVSLMYRRLTSAKDTDDSSIGFDRDRSRRQQELTN